MQTIHIALRFSDAMFDVGDVLAQHQAVLDEHGAVWFGKFGKALADANIRQINQQVQEGVPTFLYLIQRVQLPNKRRGYEVYKARVVTMESEAPAVDDPLVPSYYDERELRGVISLWTKVSSLHHVSPEVLARLRVRRSHGRLGEVLKVSVAAMFIVVDEGRAEAVSG